MKHRTKPRFFQQAVAAAVALSCGGYLSASLAADANLPLRISSSVTEAQGISGQLQDNRNSFLQGAIVRIAGTNRETTTDRQGRFRFDGLQPGSYQLEVSYLGLVPSVCQPTFCRARGWHWTYAMAMAMWK